MSSLGSGNAGLLTVNVDFIKLDNQGKLQAATALGEGGNINIIARDLISMRINSLISARADNNGNGGNIKINAPFIVTMPREDNDITANAFGGRGGNINITANGIYGLQYRPSLTEFSDINASSQFGVNGTVQINTPDVDPSRGLVELPTNLVDASRQIAQACTPGSRQHANYFVITGRGGLLPSPTEPLQDWGAPARWIQLEAQPSNPPSSEAQLQATQVLTTPQVLKATRIVEASGWVIKKNGNIELVATNKNINPHSPWQTPTSCTAPH